MTETLDLPNTPSDRWLPRKHWQRVRCWKDADPDISILTAAKKEYVKINYFRTDYRSGLWESVRLPVDDYFNGE